MDYLVIILIVASALLSFQEKKNKKRKSIMKELFGDEKPPEMAANTPKGTFKKPMTQQQPKTFNKEIFRGTQAEKPIMPNHQPAMATTSTLSDEYYRMNNRSGSITIQKPIQDIPLQSDIDKNQNDTAGNNTSHSENDKISHIIDGFDMETAVIYAEILKPKFED